MEQHKAEQILDELQEKYGEQSIVEQMCILEMLLAGESKQTCIKYIKGELGDSTQEP